MSATTVKAMPKSFKPSDDILLPEEVKSQNPYSAPNKNLAWNKVVAILNAVPLFSTPLDERAVKDRTVNLLKYFRTEDIKNRVKSGTEEQYGRLQELLGEIDCLLKITEEDEKAKKRARDEKEDELRSLSKVMKISGEKGRARAVSEESSADHRGDSEERREFLLENGGDERDWVEEKAKRLEKAPEKSSSKGELWCDRQDRQRKEQVMNRNGST